MAFISTQELKQRFVEENTTEVAGYVKAASDYLSDMINKQNDNIENSLIVALAPDYRVSSVKLFSAEDTTSPVIELDYGLLKNSRYTVPSNILVRVEDGIAEMITTKLPPLGYTIEPFYGYIRNFGIIDQGITEESFRPVRCYRIKWSNA